MADNDDDDDFLADLDCSELIPGDGGVVVVQKTPPRQPPIEDSPEDFDFLNDIDSPILDQFQTTAEPPNLDVDELQVRRRSWTE